MYYYFWQLCAYNLYVKHKIFVCLTKTSCAFFDSNKFKVIYY